MPCRLRLHLGVETFLPHVQNLFSLDPFHFAFLLEVSLGLGLDPASLLLTLPVFCLFGLHSRAGAVCRVRLAWVVFASQQAKTDSVRLSKRGEKSRSITNIHY